MLRSLLIAGSLAFGWAAVASAQDPYYPSTYVGSEGGAGCAACSSGCGWSPYCGPSGYSEMGCLWNGYRKWHPALSACHQPVGGCEGCHRSLGCGHLFARCRACIETMCGDDACCGETDVMYHDAAPEAMPAEAPQQPTPADAPAETDESSPSDA
jgi:hypothetical protein